MVNFAQYKLTDQDNISHEKVTNFLIHIINVILIFIPFIYFCCYCLEKYNKVQTGDGIITSI